MANGKHLYKSLIFASGRETYEIFKQNLDCAFLTQEFGLTWNTDFIDFFTDFLLRFYGLQFKNFNL